MEQLTKISLDLAAVALIHNAAAKFLTIQRLQERFKGTEPKYLGLEGALEYVLVELKENIGVE